MPEDDPIARLIGRPAAIKLSAAHGGRYFTLSRSQLVRRRNAGIVSDRAAGAPARLVALKYGLAERTVRWICQGEGFDRAPPPVFGLRRRRLQAAMQGSRVHDRHPRDAIHRHG